MRAEARSGAALSAPYALFLLAFAAYPAVFALALVLMRWDLVTAPEFAGMDNLRRLAGDARFWQAVGNTFVFLGIHLPLPRAPGNGAGPGAGNGADSGAASGPVAAVLNGTSLQGLLGGLR